MKRRKVSPAKFTDDERGRARDLSDGPVRLYYKIGGDVNYIEVEADGAGAIKVRGCDAIVVMPKAANLIRIEARDL